jgi:transcriptional regulator with XRE-family HTH domain
MSIMDDFGQILRSLRRARNLSQQQLATMSSISIQTIHRAEQGRGRAWRRSTLMEVLRTLDRVQPVSREEMRNYLAAAGVPDLSSAIASARLSSGLLGVQAQTSIDDQTAHIWLERLISERGAINVLSSLEGLAAAWAIDLPPRVNDAHHLPRWVRYDREDESGYHVTVYTPVNPPQSTPSSPPAVNASRAPDRPKPPPRRRA